MRFTARPSSRSQDTPGRESGGRAGVGGGPLRGSPKCCCPAGPKPRLSALQETLRSRVDFPQPPHRLLSPINLADALRDQVSAAFSPEPRCRGEGLPGWGLGCLGRGLGMLMTPAWLLSAELARRCQGHLQHTVKYGGRRQLPSPGEMQAFLVRGVQAAGCSGAPSGWGGRGLCPLGG